MKINELIEDPNFLKCLISSEIINFTGGKVGKKLNAKDVAICFNNIAKQAFKEGARAALSKIDSKITIDD